MAPIPENNQDNPPNGNKDDSEIGHFSNPNLVFPVEGSDSSDDDNEDNLGAPNGYSLLPQEPGDPSDDESDDDNDNFEHGTYIGDGTHQSSGVTNTSSVEESTAASDLLPEAVLSSEAGASAPTASLSTESCHPAFLAKFPDGKIPSYMQVPSLPKDKDSHLWNQQRKDTHKFSMDSAQESKILKAMSGFSLPSESIPDWARNLPEDQWRQQVVNRIGSHPLTERQTGDSTVKQWSQENSQEGVTQGSVSSEVTQGSVSSEESNWVAEFSKSDINKK